MLEEFGGSVHWLISWGGYAVGRTVALDQTIAVSEVDPATGTAHLVGNGGSGQAAAVDLVDARHAVTQYVENAPHPRRRGACLSRGAAIQKNGVVRRTNDQAVAQDPAHLGDVVGRTAMTATASNSSNR